MKINEIIKKHQLVQGDFNDLNRFDFEGVYIIYEEDSEEIVYVGSSYARKIKERLTQYTKERDTGNTLMHAICKKDYNVKKVKDIDLAQKKKAVEKIKTLKIYAISHQDLEYQLIHECNPIYNTAGALPDYTEN